MRFATLAFFLVLLPVLPTAVASTEDDFRIVLSPGAPPRVEGDVQATLVRETGGQSLEWNLRTTKARLIGVVDVQGYFDVARPQQVLPEVDDHFPPQCTPASGVAPDAVSRRYFSPVSYTSLEESAECARVSNSTGTPASFQLRVAFPINQTRGNATFALTRDVTPPGFSLGVIRDITHIGFYTETTTTEWAYADLMIRPAEGGETVRNPTALPARLQRFPIQGLKAAMAYTFHVEFTDWSGNQARSEDVAVTTAAAPVVAKPQILAVTPEDESHMADVDLVTVTFADPDHEITGVSFFLNKAPVASDLVNIEEGRATFVPTEGLAPGRHHLSVEVTNSAGARAVEQWTVYVEPPAPAPGLEAGLFMTALLTTILTRRRLPAATVKVK